MLKIISTGFNGKEYQAVYEGQVEDSERVEFIHECMCLLHEHMRTKDDDWNDAPMHIYQSF